uniref:Uncharacterized protein n=1 Tax=Oryza nivara TaxID=4536 RepID=A0A0E0JB82_ORYNI
MNKLWFWEMQTFIPYSQNNPSSSVVIPAPMSAKPSALQMPSPSVGSFTQLPYHMVVVLKSIPRGDLVEYFFCETSQPVDTKSILHPTKQLPMNFSADSNLLLQPVTRESSLSILAYSFPGFEDVNVCYLKQPCQKILYHIQQNLGIETIKKCQMLMFSSLEMQLLHSNYHDARNGMPHECHDALCVGRGTIEGIEPIEGTHYLKAIFVPQALGLLRIPAL